VLFEYSGNGFGKSHLQAFSGTLSKNFVDVEVKASANQNKLSLSTRKMATGPIALTQTVWKGFSHLAGCRSWDHIRSNDANIYIVEFPVLGSIKVRQNGQEILVKNGDIAICTTTKPYVVESYPDCFQHNSTLTVY